MVRLALLRHGHTGWNRKGQIQGRTDMPLDDEARAHLSCRSLPPPWDRAHLVSSPLSRAVETAQLVSGHDPQVVDALIEMHWGEWEGAKGVDLLSDPNSGYRHIEDWGWDYRPPGGESPRDVRGRLLPWAQALRGDTVSVCHIGIMRVLLAHATNWAFQGPAPFQVKRDRLFIIQIDADSWRMDETPIRLVERSK